MIKTIATWPDHETEFSRRNELEAKLFELLGDDFYTYETAFKYERNDTNERIVTRGWPSRESAETWKAFIESLTDPAVISIEIIEDVT